MEGDGDDQDDSEKPEDDDRCDRGWFEDDEQNAE